MSNREQQGQTSEIVDQLFNFDPSEGETTTETAHQQSPAEEAFGEYTDGVIVPLAIGAVAVGALARGAVHFMHMKSIDRHWKK